MTKSVKEEEAELRAKLLEMVLVEADGKVANISYGVGKAMATVRGGAYGYRYQLRGYLTRAAKSKLKAGEIRPALVLAR